MESANSSAAHAAATNQQPGIDMDSEHGSESLSATVVKSMKSFFEADELRELLDTACDLRRRNQHSEALKLVAVDKCIPCNRSISAKHIFTAIQNSRANRVSPVRRWYYAISGDASLSPQLDVIKKVRSHSACAVLADVE